MEQFRIEVPTSERSLEDLRERLDRTIADLFPPGLLRSEWEEGRLRLTGPGAEASVTLEGGNLIGEASLGPPASFMRSTIEQKVGEALRRVATGEDDD